MSHILFLSRWFPDPPSNGSKLRIFNLLRGLSQQHDITLLSFYDPAEDPGAARTLPDICRHVEAIPWKTYDPTTVKARLGALSPRPRFVVDTFSPQLDASLRRLLASRPFDAVIASQLDMAIYSDAFSPTPALFEEIEVATLYEQFKRATSTPARLRYGLTWFKHRRYLRRILKNFAAGTVVSEQEQRLLALAVPHFRATVIPNGVDTAHYTGIHSTTMGNGNAAAKNQLVYTGALTYDANYEAVTWFIEQILPIVRGSRPDVTLTITGKHGNRPLPAGDGVRLTGFVDDVRPLVAGAAISIAPILTGGGTRLKILEAMALGTPVISTSKGAEGLGATHGEHLLLADDPEQFAHSIVHLLEDPQKAKQLAANARCFVELEYDWRRIMPRFLDLVESVIMNGNVRPGRQS